MWLVNMLMLIKSSVVLMLICDFNSGMDFLSGRQQIWSLTLTIARWNTQWKCSGKRSGDICGDGIIPRTQSKIGFHNWSSHLSTNLGYNTTNLLLNCYLTINTSQIIQLRNWSVNLYPLCILLTRNTRKMSHNDCNEIFR